MARASRAQSRKPHRTDARANFRHVWAFLSRSVAINCIEQPFHAVLKYYSQRKRRKWIINTRWVMAVPTAVTMNTDLMEINSIIIEV